MITKKSEAWRLLADVAMENAGSWVFLCNYLNYPSTDGGATAALYEIEEGVRAEMVARIQEDIRAIDYSTGDPAELARTGATSTYGESCNDELRAQVCLFFAEEAEWEEIAAETGDKRMTDPKPLHPDVYDALELSALVHGGVGRDSFAKFFGGDPRSGDCPNCIHGHALFLEGNEEYGAVCKRLWDAGIEYDVNDEAVNGDVVIDWEEYCKRTGIVRADVDTFDPANFEEKVYVTLELIDSLNPCEDGRGEFAAFLASRALGGSIELTLENFALVRAAMLPWHWFVKELVGRPLEIRCREDYSCSVCDGAPDVWVTEEAILQALREAIRNRA